MEFLRFNLSVSVPNFLIKLDLPKSFLFSRIMKNIVNGVRIEIETKMTAKYDPIEFPVALSFKSKVN